MSSRIVFLLIMASVIPTLAIVAGHNMYRAITATAGEPAGAASVITWSVVSTLAIMWSLFEVIREHRRRVAMVRPPYTVVCTHDDNDAA